jgi:hypothetical protein
MIGKVQRGNVNTGRLRAKDGVVRQGSMRGCD